MIKVFEVNTVERVERKYLVQLDSDEMDIETIRRILDSEETEEEWKALAEEQVTTGEVYKFTEGNADIEEVLSVEKQS